MAIKQIGVIVDDQYLNAEAKLRKISRTRLATLLVEKIIEARLVQSIIGDPIDLSLPHAPKYRRFGPKA